MNPSNKETTENKLAEIIATKNLNLLDDITSQKLFEHIQLDMLDSKDLISVMNYLSKQQSILAKIEDKKQDTNVNVNVMSNPQFSCLDNSNQVKLDEKMNSIAILQSMGIDISEDDLIEDKEGFDDDNAI